MKYFLQAVFIFLSFALTAFLVYTKLTQQEADEEQRSETLAEFRPDTQSDRSSPKIQASQPPSKPLSLDKDDPTAILQDLLEYVDSTPPGPDQRQYLLDQWTRMAANQAWVENPPDAFLESIDILVYTRAGEEARILVDWLLHGESPALRKASALALERLIFEPEGYRFEDISMEEVTRIPADFQGWIVGRADPAHPPDIQRLEAFLLSQPAGSPSTEAFFSSYPSLTVRLVDGLFSEPMTLSSDYAINRLNGTRDLYLAWKNDPRFKAYLSQIEDGLTKIQYRLGE